MRFLQLLMRETEWAIGAAQEGMLLAPELAHAPGEALGTGTVTRAASYHWEVKQCAYATLRGAGLSAQCRGPLAP